MENFSINKLNEQYMYCDILDERLTYDGLITFDKENSQLIGDGLEKVLKGMPQIRYYSELKGDFKVGVKFTTINPLAVVKRLVQDKSVISFVFKS